MDYALMSSPIFAMMAQHVSSRGQMSVLLASVGPVPSLVLPVVGMAGLVLFGVLFALRSVRRKRAVHDRFDLAEREMLHANALYRLLADNTTDIILRIDRGGKIVFVSPAADRISAGLSHTLFGKRLLNLVDEPCQAAIGAAIVEVIDLHGRVGWTEFRGQGLLTPGWFELRLEGLYDEGGDCYGAVAIVRDIGARKALELRLAEAEMTDPLTGLANRRAFLARLDSHIASEGEADAGWGCLAIFAIDHLKVINDRHGHEVGDGVLQGFATIVRSLVRTSDLVGRIGGQSFAVLLPHADLAQAEIVTKRINSRFSGTTSVVRGSIVRATASCGVACIEHDSNEALKQAEFALHSARARGRDRVELAMTFPRPIGSRW